MLTASLTLLALAISGQAYIPVTNQDACFRVLDKFQYKARICSNGYSLTNRRNDVVVLLKRFLDGVKNDLSGVIHLNKGATIV